MIVGLWPYRKPASGDASKWVGRSTEDPGLRSAEASPVVWHRSCVHLQGILLLWVEGRMGILKVRGFAVQVKHFGGVFGATSFRYDSRSAVQGCGTGSQCFLEASL